MSKYIDVDKLKAEIEKALKASELHRGEAAVDGSRQTLYWIKDVIISLQQEQVVNKELGTLIACDIIEMTVKKAIDKPQDKEKEEKLMTRKINYLRSLEENYIQQEQPEVVDLEKDIQECWQSWVSPSNQDSVDGVFPKTEFAFYARHFYELGLNARKEK